MPCTQYWCSSLSFHNLGTTITYMNTLQVILNAERLRVREDLRGRESLITTAERTREGSNGGLSFHRDTKQVWSSLC